MARPRECKRRRARGVLPCRPVTSEVGVGMFRRHHSPRRAARSVGVRFETLDGRCLYAASVVTGGGDFFAAIDRPAVRLSRSVARHRPYKPVAAAPATVATIRVDDGTTQRSRVRTVYITLLGTIPPANIAAGAFTLTQMSGPVIESYGVTITSVTTPATGQTKISLAFTGAGVVAGSIADGRYTLGIDGSKMTDGSGVPVDALGNGTPGSVRPFLLHRLFGDSDGDSGVSINDFNAFAAAFGSIGPAAAFRGAFDFDGDNGISINDFNQFAMRFGRTV